MISLERPPNNRIKSNGLHGMCHGLSDIEKNHYCMNVKPPSSTLLQAMSQSVVERIVDLVARDEVQVSQRKYRLEIR